MSTPKDWGGIIHVTAPRDHTKIVGAAFVRRDGRVDATRTDIAIRRVFDTIDDAVAWIVGQGAPGDDPNAVGDDPTEDRTRADAIERRPGQ